MSPLSAAGFLTAGVIIACWLAYLTNTLLDLRDWTQQVLTGRPHGEVADDVDEALRRFSFGGGNDGRNFAVSDHPGQPHHPDPPDAAQKSC